MIQCAKEPVPAGGLENRSPWVRRSRASGITRVCPTRFCTGFWARLSRWGRLSLFFRGGSGFGSSTGRRGGYLCGFFFGGFLISFAALGFSFATRNLRGSHGARISLYRWIYEKAVCFWRSYHTSRLGASADFVSYFAEKSKHNRDVSQHFLIPL